MAKQESLKDQLKKAAKKRLARNTAFSQSGAGADGISGSHANGQATPGAAANAGSSGSSTNRSLDIIINALLSLDKHRADLNDRAILVGLKSVLRGYAGAEPSAAAVYHAVVEAKKEADIQPRPLRAAIDELLQIVTAYGSNRETPRAALTYLHSVAS